MSDFFPLTKRVSVNMGIDDPLDYRSGNPFYAAFSFFLSDSYSVAWYYLLLLLFCPGNALVLEMEEADLATAQKAVADEVEKLKLAEEEKRVIQAEADLLRGEKEALEGQVNGVEQENSQLKKKVDKLRVSLAAQKKETEGLQAGLVAQRKEMEARFAAQKKELEIEYQRQVDEIYFFGYHCCMKKNDIMHDIPFLPSDDEDAILVGLPDEISLCAVLLIDFLFVLPYADKRSDLEDSGKCLAVVVSNRSLFVVIIWMNAFSLTLSAQSRFFPSSVLSSLCHRTTVQIMGKPIFVGMIASMLYAKANGAFPVGRPSLVWVPLCPSPTAQPTKGWKLASTFQMAHAEPKVGACERSLVKALSDQGKAVLQVDASVMEGLVCTYMGNSMASLMGSEATILPGFRHCEARFSPDIMASYSTLLFDARNPSRMACSNCSPVEDCSRSPTPDPDDREAPSTRKVHHSFLCGSPSRAAFFRIGLACIRCYEGAGRGRLHDGLILVRADFYPSLGDHDAKNFPTFTPNAHLMDSTSCRTFLVGGKILASGAH
ncbi:hypothetical protein CK203_100861 [Vitis vinifera]|uniref:Uncharacterized protein n=1 Tax=Vitis vinifera TaxID=29760 RepID=A0A438CZG0_VITVI|nr:hypothetical protein CK203_100861 [Vitis vinifera]